MGGAPEGGVSGVIEERVMSATVGVRRVLAALVLSCGGVLATAATAAAASVELGGGPLHVSVGELGQCQSSYAVNGQVTGNFFPSTSPTGDCGFFIATPSNGSQPTALANEGHGRVFGFNGGKELEGFVAPEQAQLEKSKLVLYAPDPNAAPSGSGTPTDPYKAVTVYDAMVGSTPYLQITQTTEYVTGAPYFTVGFQVQNVYEKPVYYRAMYAADLSLAGIDEGTGVINPTAPRFVGGRDAIPGALAGFRELRAFGAAQTPEWSSYAESFAGTLIEEGNAVGGIWYGVKSATEGVPFNGLASANYWDNGIGVAWDTNLTAGLEPGQTQTYAITNEAVIPAPLAVEPAAQSVPAGSSATITVAGHNTAGEPYANVAARYTVTGANPQEGSVTTNAQGVAQIHIAGASPGTSSVAIFLDLRGAGAQNPGDPAGGAQVTFSPVAPTTPNSSITVKYVRANPDGSLSVAYVPVEAGAGTLTVTVPAVMVKKGKRCPKGTVRRKRRCFSRALTVGSASSAGTAGVLSTLTIKPKGTVLAALRKGRKLAALATISYQSGRGGAPQTDVFHRTLAIHRKRAHRRKRRKRK